MTEQQNIVLTPEEEASLAASFHRSRIFQSIVAERARQDAKWGEAVNRGLGLTTWATVLGEEVGEVCQAILKNQRDELRKELIQSAAVCVAMLECLDDAPWGFDKKDAG